MKPFLITVVIVALISCVNNKQENSEQSKTKNVAAVKDTSNLAKHHNQQQLFKCKYENEVSSLGIGLVKAPRKLAVYNDSLLTGKPITIDMQAIADDTLTSICTKYYYPEYEIMYFVCTGKTEKAYQVLVNYSEIRYLPKTKGYVFQTWDEHLLAAMGITRNTNDAGELLQPTALLRKEPKDNADTLAIPPGAEMFCAMKVQGDWVQVKYDCFYNQNPNPHEGYPCHSFINKCKDTLAGWLRWRKDNKVLIGIALFP
jgi:hypothetical protein